MKNQKNVTLRIGDDLLEKLYYVAKSEGRSLNNQFLLMARNSVAYFEKTKGKIDSAKLREIREEMEKELSGDEQ
jgi:DNA-directed RNA polymerase subunit F